MMHRMILIVSAVGAICLAGCGGSAKTTLAAPELLTAPDSEQLMAAAQETLGRMFFVMDKYDLEAGYLRTRPKRASQFFEPWRQDNASATAFAQANLDSLRRTIEVFVEPHAGAAGLRCVVTVEKLSLPPQPVPSMSQMAGLYTDITRTLQTLTLEKDLVRQMEWIDLGPDHALEHRIVTRIQKQLRKG